MPPTDFTAFANLPIHAHKQAILDAVAANQVTIITAETGAGKSTQVPQYLAEAGYQRVIVTQPRILAARNLSERVRQEYSWALGRDASGLVGYRTAHERDDGPDNVILYCTDGLQLVRELTGSGASERQILVLDEVHEWNENMEVLVAWAKKRMLADPTFKVVLMSATIEAEALAAYYGYGTPITISGRSFPVVKKHGKDLISEITQLLQTQTSNMLVFLPGKAEIEMIAEAIRPYAKNVPIISLHSQLEPALQQLAFDSYPQGKIILSTNIAQTSITIDDIDVVVDSGLERRAEVRSGVEGLFIEQISQADCQQRAGRAGRTKEGLYILAGLPGLPCSNLADRPAYGVPEILRKHIDRLVLRLANIGIDITSLDFYHAPSRRTIKQAKQTLNSLGALTPGGHVTDIGKAMERFPVESSYARMLVEAKQYPSELQAQLATIIAIQEVGGIIKGGPRYSGWRKFTKQTHSDLLAQYDIYLQLPDIELHYDPTEIEDIGIVTKNAHKAQEIADRLYGNLGLHGTSLAVIQEPDIEPLLKCIVAGQLHQLWSVQPDGQALHFGSSQLRELSSGTVVKHTSLVAGTPFDLEIASPSGLEVLHLVNQLTAVDPAWLESLAPSSYKIQRGKIFFDARYGTLASRTTVKFNGQVYQAASTPVFERTHDNKRSFISLYSSWLHEQLEQERSSLQQHNQRRIPAVPLEQVQRQVAYLAEGAISLVELGKKQRVALSKLAHLDTYLGANFMAGLTTTEPSGKRKHFARRGSPKPSSKRLYKRRAI